MATNFDDLMDMNMTDVEDLPPVGIPPTGHYNLLVTATRESKDGGNEFVKFAYTVESVNEVKNPAEQDQAAVGMNFVEFYSPLKKDGTVNEWGMKFLKQSMAPFAAHFGGSSFSEVLTSIDKVSVAASLVRTVDKRDTDRFNFRLSDVIVL
jgi:hypothetical protein